MAINIGQMASFRAALSPSLEAYVEPAIGQRVSYAELDAYTNRCANLLAELGVKAGERIALLLPNSLELVGMFIGAAKAGVVAVTLNTRLTAAELSFIVSDSGAGVLFYSQEFEETVKAIRASEEYPCKIATAVPTGGGEGGLQTRLDATSDAAFPICSGDDDNLFIMYTSGTTGLPKGVVHTHKSVFMGATAMTSSGDFRYRDRVLIPLPMFHVSALIAIVACVQRGITLVSMPKFDPSKIWTLIAEEEVTICGAVTAILNFMRQVPEFERFNSPVFRFFLQGGSPLPKNLVEIFQARDIGVSQGYALTESCTVGTILPNEDAVRKAGSAGRPSMFCELCLRDAHGNRSQRGEGEVMLKGDFLLKEYWNRPDATAEVFEEGWFRTGDIAEIDDEGFVYIKDRLKDMIISGGENIYPAELENAILGHPTVREVAVIGLSDDKWGEIACAIVVASSAEASEEAILAHCEAKLSRFKLPKRVIFVEEIPRNAAGKVLKRLLRDKYAS
jgi:O-succinylbenzoate-CoA ligase